MLWHSLYEPDCQNPSISKIRSAGGRAQLWAGFAGDVGFVERLPDRLDGAALSPEIARKVRPAGSLAVWLRGLISKLHAYGPHCKDIG